MHYLIFPEIIYLRVKATSNNTVITWSIEWDNECNWIFIINYMNFISKIRGIVCNCVLITCRNIRSGLLMTYLFYKGRHAINTVIFELFIFQDAIVMIHFNSLMERINFQFASHEDIVIKCFRQKCSTWETGSIILFPIHFWTIEYKYHRAWGTDRDRQVMRMRPAERIKRLGSNHHGILLGVSIENTSLHAA